MIIVCNFVIRWLYVTCLRLPNELTVKEYEVPKVGQEAMNLQNYLWQLNPWNFGHFWPNDRIQAVFITVECYNTIRISGSPKGFLCRSFDAPSWHSVGLIVPCKRFISSIHAQRVQSIKPRLVKRNRGKHLTTYEEGAWKIFTRSFISSEMYLMSRLVNFLLQNGYLSTPLWKWWKISLLLGYSRSIF